MARRPSSPSSQQVMESPALITVPPYRYTSTISVSKTGLRKTNTSSAPRFGPNSWSQCSGREWWKARYIGEQRRAGRVIRQALAVGQCVASIDGNVGSQRVKSRVKGASPNQEWAALSWSSAARWLRCILNSWAGGVQDLRLPIDLKAPNV